MTGDEDAATSQVAEGVSIEAHVSDQGRAYVAGRDLHLRYESGGAATRKVRVGEVVEECPYPGLAAFTAENARWFFGRDSLLAELTDLLSEQPAGQGPVVLVASSGAGKSSLLRAGLLPALDEGALPQAGSRRWPRLLFTPTAHPLAVLASQLSAITKIPPERVTTALSENPGNAADLIDSAISAGLVPGGVAIVVDQFEEAFALCDDEAERRIFVDALCAIGSAADPPAGLVVLSLRADFYQHACAYPVLRQALRDRQLLMGPMTAAEVRQAIVAPSQAVGLELEPGLVELIIRDLGGSGDSHVPAGLPGYEAGRLPLLAHALRATWQRRHGHLLTVDGYLATGGIPHAIAASAERTFGRLEDAEQELARRFFLRMVRIGDRTEDTRRHVTHTELVADSGDPAVAEAVIDVFTRARLLTHERESVEITHEALLREWPRLRTWIDTDHAGRLFQQDLEEEAADWDEAGRDTARLYRGAQLAAAVTWAASATIRAELTSRAQAFLAASVRQRRRAALLRRSIIATLTVLVLGASGLAAIALLNDHTAIKERDQAIFNEVSSEGSSLSSVNPSLAAQFDLAAYRRRPTPGLYTSLLNTEAAGIGAPLGTVPAPVPVFSSMVTFGRQGRILAGAGGRTIRLWSTANPYRAVLLGTLPRAASAVDSVSISADGRLLAAALGNGTVQLWDITDPAHPHDAGKPLHIPLAAGLEAAFDPAGPVLLAWFNWKGRGALQLWNVGQPANPKWVSYLVPCNAVIDSVTVSPDGNHAAVGCSNGEVHLANVERLARLRAKGWMSASNGNPVTSLAFSSDGKTLVSAAYNDSTFRLWNVADTGHPAAVGTPVDWLNNGVYSLSFAPGSSVLVTTDHDGSVQLWNTADADSISNLGPALTAAAGPALDAAFSPNGQTIAVDYVDGTIRQWSVPHSLVVADGFGQGYGIAFSSDGRLLASSNNLSDTLNLWETGGRALPRRAGSPVVCKAAKRVGTELIAFSPRSPVLATGCFGGFQLWDLTDPAHVAPLSPWLPSTPANSWVNSVRFDHSGKLLAEADNGYVTLWNVADPAHPARLSSVSLKVPPGNWTTTSISPDGHTLAAAANTTVKLWDITAPTRPRLIAKSLAGPTQWVTALVFSHDGGMLAAGSADDSIYLWKKTRSHPWRPLRALSGHTDLVTDLAFSPNDKILASSSYDETVRLWNTAPAGPLGNPLTGHTDYALGVAFSPASNTLVSIGNDNSVYQWDLNVNDAISRICAATARALTPGLWRRDLPGVPYSPPCPAR